MTLPLVGGVCSDTPTCHHTQDYKTYLDFVLAMENRGEPQSLQYFFRLLDIRACGYLDAFTLKYFFRVRAMEEAVSCCLQTQHMHHSTSPSPSPPHLLQAIQEMMNSQDQEPVSFDDVKDEIFDMVKPADPQIITLVDLTSR